MTAGKYAPAKWYVYRLKGDHEGWVGPLSLRRAQAEAAAWEREGYSTRIEGATPQIRALVNRWQREADARLGRTHRTGKSSYGRLRARRGSSARSPSAKLMAGDPVVVKDPRSRSFQEFGIVREAAFQGQHGLVLVDMPGHDMSGKATRGATVGQFDRSQLRKLPGHARRRR